MTVKEFITIYYGKATRDNLVTLLVAVTHMTLAQIIANGNIQLTEEQEAELIEKMTKNIEGKPVAYLLKRRPFFNNEFYVDENVLIPQPDTETLVTIAFGAIMCESGRKKPYKYLDMCTGSGCVGISASNKAPKNKKTFELILSDISPEALKVCKKNVEDLLEKGTKYRIVQSDLFESFKDEKFDLITANPPYIPSGIIDMLDIEVQNEPRIALDGGIDGLEIIRKIIVESKDHLTEDGVLALEVGYDQSKIVEQMMIDNGFENISIEKDLSGIERVVLGIIKDVRSNN